ncbi:MAG: glycoside hydrolase family 38 C-terminal domain-containing protein [Planctomycetota bacterium]
MTPINPHQILGRIKRLIKTVLEPKLYVDVSPLNVSVAHYADPVPYAQATQSDFQPATLPYRWGPTWSTAWYKLSGIAARPRAGLETMLRIEMDGEGLVWKDGAPWHGVSQYHQRIPWTPGKDGRVEFFIEAAANGLFGERYLTGNEDLKSKSYLVSKMDIVSFNPEVYGLIKDLEFLADLQFLFYDKLAKASGQPWTTHSVFRKIPPRARAITRTLASVADIIDSSDPLKNIKTVRKLLADCINAPAAPGAAVMSATGHSHIDVAWLWPLRETRRKCSRTFSTVLRNMERYPEYRFLQSQAQLYAYVEKDYPALFEGIKARVADGRWEANGAMWVEADCNIASGEALVRQILHADRYFKSRFGAHVEQTYLWLPDVFGYSPALPGILRHCGIDTFFTQKISWSQYNRFPMTTFDWQGIDGSRVLSHFLPADTYNGNALPTESNYGDENNQESDIAPMWLNSFGYGDGGGGPTPDQIEYLRRSDDCDGLPKTKSQLPDAFRKELIETVKGKDLPVWVGELYLELHRGTLTSQGQNKRSNRRSENGLRTAELWATVAQRLCGAAYPADALDNAWKLTLLNQFHDVLPGSSIGWVYRDSAEQYADIAATVETIKATAFASLAAAVKGESAKAAPCFVFNSTEFCGDAVVELPESKNAVQSYTDIDGRECGLAIAGSVPAMGYKRLDGETLAERAKARFGQKASASACAVKTTDRALENEFLSVSIDDAGRVTSLVWKPTMRELTPSGGSMNRLTLYEDRPTNWDAWDIDIQHLGSERPIQSKATIRVVSKGPLRGEIEIKRSVGAASTLTQRIRLDAFSPKLDFITRVDWHEDRMLLRVLNDIDARSETATYEMQYGCVDRPTHFNTSWDHARFEVPCHTWALLADRQTGVALLNDSKYGYSCLGSALGMSLLRSPKEPDSAADMRCHDFTYSLMPFDASAPANPELANRLPAVSHPLELISLYARLLNIPFDAFAPQNGSKPAKNAKLPEVFAAFPSLPGARIEAFKKAEDSDDIIIRLTDSVGKLSGDTEVALSVSPLLKVKSARLTDGLERRIKDAELPAGKGMVKVPMNRFGIRAVALT